MSFMKWKIICDAYSDIGLRETNEDAYTVWNKVINDENFALFAVADGMGGLQNGEDASSIMISDINRWARKLCYILSENGCINYEEELKDLLNGANQHVLSYGKKKQTILGTTVTMLLFIKDNAYLAHVGDSTACQINQSFISILSEKHAATLGNRHGLTSCIGVRPQINQIQIKSIAFEAPAHFLVGSDGIFNLLDLNDRQTIDIITKSDNMLQSIKKIVQNVRIAGESDNATGILIKVENG